MGVLYSNFLKRKKLGYGGDWTQTGPIPHEEAYLGDYMGAVPKEEPAVKGKGFNYGAAIGVGASLASEYINANERPLGQYERYAAGSQESKSALNGVASGASAGASFGPWGAVIGGVIGGGIGYFKGKKLEKERNKEVNSLNSAYIRDTQQQQMYDAQKNKDYFDTTRQSQMYGNGGKIDSVTTQVINNPRATMLIPKNGTITRTYLSPPEGLLTEDELNYLGHKNGGRSEVYNQPSSYTDYSDYTHQKIQNLSPEQVQQLNTYYKNRSLGTSIFQALPNIISNHRGKNNRLLALGGSLASNYMSNQMAIGGNLIPTSSSTTEVKGPSHEQGGVQLPAQKAEVEGGETLAEDYVFSKELGFAKLHKPIAKAKGKIEKKPATPERVKALELLNKKEERLKATQEYFKQQLNLQ